MKLSSYLFPPESRSFAGKRGVSITLRSLHLIGIAGVGAAFLFDVPAEQWLPYMMLTIITGAAMMLMEIWTDGIWLIQLRGMATLLKLVVLSMTLVLGLQAWILFVVILISGLMSHAPGKVRYYSFIKGTN